MKKWFVVPIVSLLAAAAFPAHAAEMFQNYEKRYAIGYLSDGDNLNTVNFRYWFNPTWALDTSVGFDRNSSTNIQDDGIVRQEDHSKSYTYALSAAAVRSIRKFEYFDLNIKAGTRYQFGKAFTDPDGPDNNATAWTQRYSLFIGPEIEIKIPYFSRLVITSSIQAIYTYEHAQTNADEVGGIVAVSKADSRQFSLINENDPHHEGNSLNQLFHVGIRYYF